MKNIGQIIYTLLLLQLVFGCQELKREDFNQIYPENFFKNESDVKNATTALYSTFNNGPWSALYGTGQQGLIVFPEATTDIMDCQWGDGGSWANLNEHTWTASSTRGNFQTPFSKYNWISRCEQVIMNIESSSVSDKIKKQYIAEIKGIQGWLAFILYDLYGPVPIAPRDVLTNITEEVNIPRPSDADFVNYIQTKLIEASSELPYSSSDWGRLTKGATKTILLKLYMMEKNWAKAEETARELMKPEYGYQLVADYNSLFDVATEVNKETILAIPCNTSDFPNAWHAHVLPYNFPYPLDVQKWSGYRMPWAFYHTYEKNDKRLLRIIGEYVGTDGVTYNEKNPGAHLPLGALPIKYGVDPNHVGESSGHDIPVYRYADVLLCLSEAINNQKGPVTEAVALVNQIRNRVGLDNLTSDKYTSKEVLNSSILLERGHELYCEGHRRQDLIRHGKYIEYARLILNNQTADYKVRFPIPNSIVVESKGAVKQNTGY